VAVLAALAAFIAFIELLKVFVAPFPAIRLDKVYPPMVPNPVATP
jgi:hypothetical protein